MPRSRRHYKSRKIYEICFRARRGLPFVVKKVIRTIISSVLARTQRDDKVTLCHDIWNGSHAHLIVIVFDEYQCVRFYMEVQKKITDAIKRLLGLNYLNLWEGRPMVAEIADLTAMKERIAYLYANPAQDDLVDSIDMFPGYSSWQVFLKGQKSLEAESKEVVPWIRLPSIKAVKSPLLSLEEDEAIARLLKIRNKAQTHDLIRKPNAWMKYFGIKTDEQVQVINQEILELIQANEEEARQERFRKGKAVMGVAKLCSQPILEEHVPKKHGRKIFVIATVNEVRLSLIAEFREFSRSCKECYERWKEHDALVVWPPGAFIPWLPPTANILGW